MFADEGYDNNGGSGPTWPMEDIMGGSLFNETYQVASVDKLPPNLRPTVEFGNKIVMPASALDTLSRLNIMYPMMFRISSDDAEPTRSTFCGVLEFSAPEGVIFLPPWMLHTLRLHAGDLVLLENVALPLGTFIRIQPQSVAFLDITDPRAVLEHSLRNFACLTVGDRVAISYNDRVYELLVQQVRPDDGRGGICVLETDLQVDFAPPVGYEEPKKGMGTASGTGSRTGGGEKSIASSLDLTGSVFSTSATTSNSVLSTSATLTGGVPSAFSAFSGSANRLSSKTKTLGAGVNNASSSGAKDTSSAAAIAASSSSTVGVKGSIASPPYSYDQPVRTVSQQPVSQSPLSPVPINLPKGTLFFGGTPSGAAISKGTSANASADKQQQQQQQQPKTGTPPPSTATEAKFTAFSGKANKLQ